MISNSFAIMPIQMIPRISMILKQIFNLMSPSNPDFILIEKSISELSE